MSKSKGPLRILIFSIQSSSPGQLSKFPLVGVSKARPQGPKEQTKTQRAHTNSGYNPKEHPKSGYRQPSRPLESAVFLLPSCQTGAKRNFFTQETSEESTLAQTKLGEENMLLAEGRAMAMLVNAPQYKQTEVPDVTAFDPTWIKMIQLAAGCFHDTDILRIMCLLI